ncbi:thymidylate kinase [Planctomycetia bacterium]|nr:thymidylate kinase [Planctomycetia bacterium]
MAPLIVIEGIDGSGKGTQAQQLTERLAATGRRVRLLSFPRYRETLFGHAIGDFLNGRFGQLNEVHPFLASVLYAADRFESKSVLTDALQQSDVVICDRYVPSNLAHQGAKLEGAERDELLRTIERIEFGVFALPRPSLVVLLNVPVDIAQRNIAAKKPRSYTDKAADLQEADAGYLQRVRDVYLQLATTDPIWQRVESVRAGKQRSITEIGDDILGRVLPTFA